ncbi:MAG: argininosuccinate lyase [Pseudomonadota bacterium]
MSDSNANAMWGGRFSQSPSELMQQINASIDVDQRMYRQDIAASQVHATMLARQGIISDSDCAAICQGLDEIRTDIDAGLVTFSVELEDIHMNVESLLREKIGPAAGRLHTARSRNDQTVTDLRLWMRDEIDGLSARLVGLILALLDKAEATADTVMPGFTHLQVAQPVTFGHHLMAYVAMFGRDHGRLQDCRRRLNQCPLGAAALAGTPFPIDRQFTSDALGFSAPTENSMDSVSARDHVAEYLFAVSMLAVHISRFAEEVTIWNSDGFKFVELSDAFTTGSSIMPQKKNPDAAELLRAKPGTVIGALNQMLIVMKGLPLTYMKDMQEDKEPLFRAADNMDLCVQVMTGLVEDMQPNADRMQAFLTRGFPTATDLADFLVRELDLPFRDAHHVTGRAVALAEEAGVELHELSLAQLQGLNQGIDESIYDALRVQTSLGSRTSYGGTAPSEVRDAIARARAQWAPAPGDFAR